MGQEQKQVKALPQKRKRKSIQKDTSLVYILSALVAVIIIVLVLYLVRPGLFGSGPKVSTDTVDQEKTLAATVNGKPIYAQEVERQWASMPADLQAVSDKVSILNQLIDEQLLLDQAEKEKITVTQAEIDAELSRLLSQNGMTQADLDTQLRSRGLDTPSFMEMFRRRMLITRLFNQTILPTVVVPEEDALAFYQENPDLFTTPEGVVAQHILTATEEDAKAVKTLLADAEFGDIAVEYSLDSSVNDSETPFGQQPGNKGNLGFFSRRQMVEEFEQAAFSLKVGEISEPVQSQFGWHIIEVLEKRPEQVQVFEDTKDSLMESLRIQRSQEAFQLYLDGLRKQAEIKIYPEFSATVMNSTTTTSPTPSPTPEGLQILAKIYESDGYADVTIMQENVQPQELRIPSVDQKVIISYLANQMNLEISAIEDAIVFSLEDTPTPAEETNLEEVSISGGDLIECLARKNVKLYGAYWNKDTQSQLAEFGESKTDVPYVECGVPGDFKAQAQACKDAGIEAYPTWLIGDRKELGFQTLARLKALTGC